jgi:hypothetical protein
VVIVATTPGTVFGFCARPRPATAEEKKIYADAYALFLNPTAKGPKNLLRIAPIGPAPKLS